MREEIHDGMKQLIYHLAERLPLHHPAMYHIQIIQESQSVLGQRLDIQPLHCFLYVAMKNVMRIEHRHINCSAIGSVLGSVRARSGCDIASARSGCDIASARSVVGCKGDRRCGICVVVLSLLLLSLTCNELVCPYW